jgi:dihydrofolate reductase (trimethoprim resistance protein)
MGEPVRKIKGSNWHGYVVGFYSTKLTKRGYNVESFFEPGSVQLYPEEALEEWPIDANPLGW